MNCYKADLHIHSVLSPCGGLEMSPKNLVQALKEAGISVFSITDHNSMANCPAYESVALKNGLHFIYGVEVQTIEEIHIIALFDDKNEAAAFDKKLYEALLPVENNPDYFGDQVIIDAEENIVDFLPKALINSAHWTLEETINELRQFDTFLFPTHIDAATFSIIGQLGFIPPDLDVDAYEITAKCNLADFLEQFPYLKGKPLIRNSDAHYLSQIGSGCSKFYIKEPTAKEIRFACQKSGGRKAVID